MFFHDYLSCSLVILVTVSAVQVSALSMLDWVWSKNEEPPPVVISDGVPLIAIPYEMLTEDEKFLKEAAKLVTDIQISSPLEICQHKVVMKIKTSCSSMTEEQLAKLSVNLLNCQSATEGRKVFACTDEMSIKECTTNMDPDTWNAYHLMSNRARAVCYAARSHQFRALTELTVNKLMQSAHSQIQTLEILKDSHERLEEQSSTAHKIIESNIKDLNDEKALIRSGHSQLVTMTEEIKKKLEKASQDLLEQSKERGKNHEEVLTDLENIQLQAQLLWDKIESSTNRIIDQNNKAALQYEETLGKLEKINKTINFIYDMTNNMRAEMDKKLGWITEYIGATGNNLERIYRITLHIIYLLLAMVVAAFLQAPFLTRTAILGIVPLNLASYLKQGTNACLDFVSISILILLITAMHYLMNGIQYLVGSMSQKDEKKETHQKIIYINGKAESNGYSKIPDETEDEIQKPSIILSITCALSSLYNHINQQIHQSIENFKAVYLSIKSSIWSRFVTTEEFVSCSYVPARKPRERIVAAGRPHSAISDDESDFCDSRDSGKFISNDISITGAILKRKISERYFNSPLPGFFKGKRDPIIRESILRGKKETSPSRVTPTTTRDVCDAKTRSGNPCRNLAARGENYCHRHSTGTSIVGD